MHHRAAGSIWRFRTELTALLIAVGAVGTGEGDHHGWPMIILVTVAAAVLRSRRTGGR